MNKTLDYYISRLPPFIGQEIFTYIIPDSKNIIFNHYYNFYSDTYSERYTFAFINSNVIKNQKRIYLCRINKKNGKHRYYLTQECEVCICQGCGETKCRSPFCRGGFDKDYYFKSKYIGKNIEKALFELTFTE
jgi:hypothetical protein